MPSPSSSTTSSSSQSPMARLMAWLPSTGRKRILALFAFCFLGFMYNSISQQKNNNNNNGGGGGGGGVRTSKNNKRTPKPPLLLQSDIDEICEGAYLSCWEWKTNPKIKEKSLEIVLIGNELFQQLPTIGYGGIETSVDNLASALVRMGIPFWAIVPKRREQVPLGFRIRETEIAPNGKGGFVDTFVKQSIAILEDEQATGEPVRDVFSSTTKPTSKDRTFAIWGQSMWSQNFAKHGAVTIVSHHDGGDPNKLNNGVWNWKFPRVWHRFLSVDQMSRWVVPGREDYAVNAPISRVISHGLPQPAYQTCVDKKYFLWVASLDWGWEEKGMDIFIEMAKRRPDYRFIAYGSAGHRKDLLAKLFDMHKEVPNFQFRGELKRGPMHFQMFCEATAFVMPTHASIGESFGMTVIESLSKGVPVIASTNGAVPEILAVPGRKGASMYGTTCEGKDFDCYVNAADRYYGRTPEATKLIQAYAWNNYDVNHVADMLLNFTLTALKETKVI